MKEIEKDYFEYINIDLTFSDDEINKNIDSLRLEFSKLTKNWTSELNSQWVARNYIAVKMILSSTILLNSIQFSKEKNIRITEPYLMYYSLLNCSRAVILTSPFNEWNDKEIFTMTHKKTINIVGDIIAKYNKEKGEESKRFIDWAREYREIFSYKFPANGLAEYELDYNATIELCQLLCELAQLQSKVLENSITKNVKSEYDLDWDILRVGFEYGEKNFNIIDQEDGYRLHYITKNQKRPYSLHLTMTEGMVEDFLGSWYPENDDNIDDFFNPDRNTQIIFPLP